METYFAPPEKVTERELENEIEIVGNNPVISGLLQSVSGLLAVLDQNRQIVALNHSFLAMLGINNPGEVLGLRHGEAVGCIHAKEEPAGCGTTKFCSSCGAAIAIVSSLQENKPVERICAISAAKSNKTVDLAFLVRSNPILINGRVFLLIFLQDITRQQQRAALERAFFHDISNMLQMLLSASELLAVEEPSELSKTIQNAAIRLHKEVAIQRCLTEKDSGIYQPLRHETTTNEVFEELQSFFENHPAATNRNVEFDQSYPQILFTTDASLLSRILCNMIINALEATQESGSVKFWTVLQGNELVFYVWNKQFIPEQVAMRIFQRNFTTKEQAGRGVGTFSMKLFGEEILGGKVDFTTHKEKGTTFTFQHPL